MEAVSLSCLLNLAGSWTYRRRRDMGDLTSDTTDLIARGYAQSVMRLVDGKEAASRRP